MELAELQRNWDAFGETDPLGAILTVPSKMGGRWQPGEFFRKGVDEIDALMDDLRALGLDPPRGEALDFGCGVGRLTQALCRHFEACHGVDIAPSMVRLARRYNRFGKRCEYHLNAAPDLSLFGDGRFAFVYSFIVLQHMRPEYARGYVREFVRVLAPGGLAVFQLPTTRSPVEGRAQPLPASARRAEIELLDAPRSLRTGQRAEVRLSLRNAGDGAWPNYWDARGCCHVRVGNRWLAPGGGVVVADDGRTGLECEMRPGDRAEVSLTVTAPDAPGHYVLEVDGVQEGVAWFGSTGSPTARTAVSVSEPLSRRISRACRKVVPAARAGQAGPTAAPGPRMEMYGIEQPEVVALIEASGGRVLDVTRWTNPDWTHARYCFTK